MNTSFSVIITSYNYRGFVAEAIESVLQQTRPALQIIVVDDGSTDGSQDLLQERYGTDLRVTLLCQGNGGQLWAFQQGVAAARAAVLCFLDADDRWEPDYLAKIGALYDSRKDVDFVFSDVALFGTEQRLDGYAAYPCDLGYTVISTYILAHWYGAPTSALSMRKYYGERSLDLPAHMRSTWKLCADNCLVYGASLHGARKYYLPTGSVGYRIHGLNGYWSKRSSTERFFNKLNSRMLINHYALRLGIDASCLELAKHEYKIKPDPDWAETKRYLRLCLRGNAPFFKRLERSLSVLLRGLRRRAGSR